MELAAMELNLMTRTIIGCKINTTTNIPSMPSEELKPLEHLDQARDEGATQAFIVPPSHQSQGRYQPAAKGNPRVDPSQHAQQSTQNGLRQKDTSSTRPWNISLHDFPSAARSLRRAACSQYAKGTRKERRKSKTKARKEKKRKEKKRKEKKRKRGGMHIGAEELCRGSSVNFRRDIVMQTPRSCSSSAVASKIGKSELFSFPLKTGWMYY